MTDKNLQASIELQVRTPGAENVTKLKKEIAELLAATTSAGGTATTSLGQVGEKLTLLAARAAAAREKEAAAAATHARKIEAIDAQLTAAKARAALKQETLVTSANARVEAAAKAQAARTEATDTAASARKAAQLLRDEARDNAAAARRAAKLQREVDQELRNIERLSLARAAAARQQDNWMNAGRVMNPNAAYGQAIIEDGKRNALLQAASADLQANSFGGKFKAAMTNWGRSAAESFSQSFKASLGGGMTNAVAGIGALMGIKAAVQDNMLYQELKNQLSLAAGSDKIGADEFEYVHNLAMKNGRDIRMVGEEYAKYSNSAKLAGATLAETHKIFTNIVEYNAAWHISDAKLKRALAIDYTEPLDIGHYNGSILNRSLPANQMGVKQLLQRSFMEKNNLDESGWKNAVSKGQVTGLGTQLLLADAMHEDVKRKLADSNKTAQAEIGRLKTVFRDFNNALGQLGAFDGFTRALRALSTVLADRGFQESFAGLAKGAAQFTDTLASLITKAGDFVKAHPVMVEGLGRWLAISGALRLGLGLLGAAVSMLLSPLMLVTGAVATAMDGTTAFGKAVALVFSPVKALGLYLAGPMITAFAGMRVASLSGAGGMAIFGTAVDGLKASLARMMSVAIAAAGALAALDIGKGVFDQAMADRAMEKMGRDKMTREQLAHESGVLGKAITDVDESSGAGDVPKAQRASRKKLLSDQKALYDGLLANSDKKAEQEATTKAQADAKKTAAELEQALTDGQKHPSMGAGKGDKGGSAGRSDFSQATGVESAHKYAADMLAADDIARAKATRDAEEKLLNEQLEQGKTSYAEYYDKKRQLANADLDAEEKAAKAKVDGEIAALEKGVKGHARDSADVQAADIKIAALRNHYAAELLTLEEKRRSVQSAITQEADKESKAFAKQIADVKAQNDKDAGRSDLSAQLADIEEKHRKLKQEAAQQDPTGENGAVAAVFERTRIETANAKIADINERLATASVEAATREAAIQLQVVQGLKTKSEAEDEILGLKKQQAVVNQELLQQSLALTVSPKAQAELEQKILAEKITVHTATRTQAALEQTVQNGMQSAMESVLNGTKGIGGALKDFVHGLTASINKMLTDELSSSFMNWMKGSLGMSGGAAGGGGGGGILGAISGLFGGGGGGAGAGAGGAGLEVGGSSIDYSGLFSSSTAAFSLFASGGQVRGPGGPTDDTVYAKLSNGEHVLTAADVEAAGGHKAIEAWRGNLHAFADGGAVTKAAAAASAAGTNRIAAAAGSAGTVVNMTVNAQDAASFRSAESQILARMQQAAQMAQRRNR